MLFSVFQTFSTQLKCTRAALLNFQVLLAILDELFFLNFVITLTTIKKVNLELTQFVL